MARFDGASQARAATGMHPLWDAQRRRFSHQIWSLRLSAWLGALASGCIGAQIFERAFPCAHEGRNSTGSQVQTEHVLEDNAISPLEWRALVDMMTHEDIAGVELLLPRPGDPRKLTSIELLDRGELAGSAIRIRTTTVNLIITPQGVHEHLMTWTIGREASDGFTFNSPLTADQADRDLRAGILEAENAIVELGLRTGSPQARDLLESAQQELAQSALPDSMGPARRSLLLRAAPMTWMCTLALDEDSVAVTRTDLRQRREALQSLDRVARYAMEAAVSLPTRV